MKKQLFFLVFIFCIAFNAKAQTPLQTTWDMDQPGSSATQLSFGVTTSGGMASYSWTSASPAGNGSGTFSGPTLTINGIPPNSTVTLKIFPQNFDAIAINNGPDKERLTWILSWGNNDWTTMQNAFRGCSNLKLFGGPAPDLSSVTNTSAMFRDCSSLDGAGNLDTWDVSNITNMSYMFSGATGFNGSISNWDVSSVTNMSFMFSLATNFNQNLSTWDVSSVTNMSYMFSGATSFNQQLNAWGGKLIGVTTMQGMFANATSFNQYINDWNVSTVTDMSYLFSNATSFNQLLVSWAPTAVTNMRYMFAGATSFNRDINSWGNELSGVTNMSHMFDGATSFNQSLNSWIVSTVTDMSYMFSDATNFNGNMVAWDPDVVTNMSYMFENATDFNIGINTWSTKVASVTNMSHMFDGAIAFNQSLTSWTPSNVTNMSYMFAGATSFNGNVSDWGANLAKVTNMSHMFENASNFAETTMNTWNVSKVTDMSYMFAGAAKFNGDITSWNVGLVANMSHMFDGALLFNENDMSLWDVTKATDMSYMFRGAVKFNTNINTWDPNLVNDMSHMFENATDFNSLLANWGALAQLSNVTDMSYMFRNATQFNKPLFAWDIGNVTNMSNMFEGAVLFNQDLNIWDVGSVTSMTAMFAGATNFNGNITNWNVSNVTNMSGMFALATNFNQNLANWNVVKVSTMGGMFFGATNFNQNLANWGAKFKPGVILSNFLDNSGLSVANYDATLIGFHTSAPTNLTMGAAGLKYCDAALQRANLDLAQPFGKGWDILGDAPVVPTLATFAITTYNIICKDPSPLPVKSDNGITGTWLPAFNNTTSGVYTFTPDFGQCATATTIASVTVTPNITPTFSTTYAVCAGASSPLPIQSGNAIDGTWSPVFNSNTTATYTFIPDPNQCASTVTRVVNIIPGIIPAFTQVSAICLGENLADLPLVSNDGFSGTWSPPVDKTKTTTYTFTPQSVPGQCLATATMVITVNTAAPAVFPVVAAICEGATPAISLPPISSDGFTGTWAPPAINNMVSTTYTFTPNPGECATPGTLIIAVTPRTTPTFVAVPALCPGANSPLPPISTNGISGTWLPVFDSNTSGVYTFTPDAKECATTATLSITITPNTIPAFTQVPAICANGVLLALPTKSNDGFDGNWSPPLDNNQTTTYTFTPDPVPGQCLAPATMVIAVNPMNTAPTFAPVGPVCSEANLSPLPTVSDNAIVGTWSPAIDNMATTVYTFTPDANQCATTTTLTITVIPSTTPTFNAIGPICSGTVAPTLATTSTNGIAGNWLPAVIDNSTSGIYTFTPTGGQCITTTLLTVTVTPSTTPTFDQIPALCAGAIAPSLVSTSTNGISGNWSPGLVDNSITTTYTFTPMAGVCITTPTMVIAVNPPNTVPTFSPVGPICSAGKLDVLPLVSANNITGTWSPGLDNTTTTVYTFTPDANQCATTTTLTITVVPNTTPTFTPINPICSGASLAALPLVSDNGIAGTWLPALNNMATTVYTFTPDANQCATTTTLTITVIPSTTPTFNAISPICAGTSLSALPILSNNLVAGTWLPTLNNMATTVYTFTPDANQCAATVTLTITVIPIVTPTFTQVPAICANAALANLPNVSLNTIIGLWSPNVDNTTTTTYTFTPVLIPGQCATTATMVIAVNPPNTVPTFTQVAPICSGTVLADLPLISINTIIGAWSPALNSTTTSTYTFTPNAGQCAIPTTMVITVNPLLPVVASITASPSASVCKGTPIDFTSVITNGGNNPTYEWFVNASVVGTNSSFSSNTLATNDQVKLVLTSDALCITTPTVNSNSIFVSIGDGEAPQVSSSKPSPLCAGEVLTLTAPMGTNYLWTTGETTRSIVVTKSGAYAVELSTGSGCTAKSAYTTVTVGDSITIALASPVFTGGYNVSKYQAMDGSVETTVSGGFAPYRFFWSNQTGNKDVEALAAGDYQLVVIDNANCVDTAYITLTSPPPLQLPRVFTPNGDGVNDFFVVKGIEVFPGTAISIYNRWGNVVFSSADYKNEWEGQTSAGNAVNGTYFVVLTAKDENGSNIVLDGYVELRRDNK